MPDSSNHISPERLRQFAVGQLDADASTEIVDHLESCDACAAALGRVSLSRDPFVYNLRRMAGGNEAGNIPTAVSGEDLPLPPKLDPREADTAVPVPRGSHATATFHLQSRRVASNVDQAAVAQKVRHFGDYELLSEIARGGMGVVYKARQVNLNRIVALKMILSGQLASSEDVHRFHAEAEAAANLDHPGIVPIFEVGQHDAQHYFSMGYVEGQSLAERLKNGPLPPKAAAELTRKIAKAIAYAHDMGVVHRDLKPANVLLDKNGEPKVTDFGLARKLEKDSGLTKTGTVMGTPSYMPPEQAAGKTSEVGPLSDVYSIGAILYCLLTGRPPFQAASPLDTLLQVMEREPVSVKTLNPQIHRDLETICHKCLQKYPAKRYASAQELADDLGRWQRGEPIQARAVSNTERAWRWVRRNPLVSGLTAATLLAFLIGGIASLYFGLWALDEANKSKSAEVKAIRAAGVSKESEERAKVSEGQAKQSEAEAIAARQQTEATLARSDYFLALARWDEGRVREANLLLDRVPRRFRNFEWRLARKEFEGSFITLKGHQSGVTSVAFSPDGTRIVSASGELGKPGGEIRLWDAVMGEQLRTLRGHEFAITSVAFSPDGTQIASGSGELERTGEIKLWDAATGEELRTLKGHEESVTSLAFSPDGTRLASGSGAFNPPGEIKLWDASTGEELRTFKGHDHGITCVAFSPDGMRIASGSHDTAIKLWDVVTGEQLRTLIGHESNVYTVAFSPDGTNLASAGQDTMIKLWDVATGEQLRTLDRHDAPVFGVAFSPDGTRIASASGDTRIKLWDLRTGEEIGDFKGHEDAVTHVAFGPDGTRIVSGSKDNTIKLWDAATDQEFRTLKGYEGRVSIEFGHLNSVAFSPDGRRIASRGGDYEIKLWDVATGEQLRTLKGHESAVSSVTFSPNGVLIASGGRENGKPGEIKVWDTSTAKEIRTLKGHVNGITSVAFSPDSAVIASGGEDRTIRLWDAATGEQLRTLKGHESAVNSVTFSPDGTQIASGGGEYGKPNEIKVWGVATGEELRTLDGHESAVNSVTFSPDGMLIASGSRDSKIKLWDAATGQELRTLKGHAKEITSVAFNPDGTRLVSGSRDSTLKLWDAATGEELRTLKRNGSIVISAAFSPDGTRVASEIWNRTIELWDAAAGEEPKTIREPEGLVRHSVFSGDGSRLVVCRQDCNSFTVWNTLNGELLRKYTGHDDAVTTAVFSDDARQVASGSQDKTVMLWDVPTARMLRVLKGHTSEITSLVFLSNDTRLISASRDKTMRIWDVTSGDMLQTLKGHTGEILVLAVSPDESAVVSAGSDESIRWWDLESGDARRSIQVPQKDVHQLVFSPDGDLFASVGRDKSIIVWDANTGQKRQQFGELPGEILSVAFSADSAKLISYDVSGRQLSWNIAAGQLLNAAELMKAKWSWSANPSIDGLIALPDAKDVIVDDLNGRPFREQERAFRRQFAAPKPRWHWDKALALESSGNQYATLFHRACLLRLIPTDGWLYDDLHETHRRLQEDDTNTDRVLPAIVREMLDVPRGADLPRLTEQAAESLNDYLWSLVRTTSGDGRQQVSNWHLQRMQDVCSKFPKGYYFNTLGVLQYRLGQYESAIKSLKKSMELTPGELGIDGPLPVDLACIAICHHNLGQSDEAAEFRRQAVAQGSRPEHVLNSEVQNFLLELQSAFDGLVNLKPEAAVGDFNREATFENLIQHRWRFWPDERYVDSFRLTSNGPHSGTTCLQVSGANGPVMAHQTIAVEPNTKYRLSGWIRTDLRLPETPKASSMPAGNSSASAPATVAGAFLGVLDRPNASVIVAGTSDWKQVTLEFTTDDTQNNITLGCRLGLPDHPVEGNAWFDDLTLESLGPVVKSEDKSPAETAHSLGRRPPDIRFFANLRVASAD